MNFLKKNRHLAVLAVALAMFSCSKEGVDKEYAVQETNIEKIVETMLAGEDNQSVLVSNKCSQRVIMKAGEGEGLGRNGTVTFRYAGYTITSTSISSSNLFATNHEETAASAGWSLEGEGLFEPVTLKLPEAGLVKGLADGMEGVKSGEECMILFSGRYGFGKHDLGTIPANSALAYHLWVENVSN